jgi:hypothetical protein
MGSFQKVERLKSKLRLALTGVSGSGKTLGALYIGYGMTGDWGKIALIDTEHERARLYANRTDLGTGAFEYCPMNPPYSADRYKSLVKEAADIVGPDGVVIVDSFSHAWNNEGGILDAKEKIAARQGQTSYTAWNEAGKIQNNLVNTILAVDCHTIVTMRSKMDYVIQENEKGKQVPVKVGLAPVQRDDTEYEFDIVLDVARNHIATASKDVTFLDNYGDVINVELGHKLKTWLDNGLNPAPKTPIRTKSNKPRQTAPAPTTQAPEAAPPAPTPEQMADVAHQKINAAKITVIKGELERTGVSEKAICARKEYGITTLEDITEELFPRVMSALKKTPTKGAKQ